MQATTHKNNCCFWIKNSETCVNAQTAALSIVAALSTIAIAAGVILLLAQQGVQLAGLNSIAQMIETKWIYAGLAASGGLLLIDTLLIAALVRSFLNKLYSEKELDELGVSQFAKSNCFKEKSPLNSFWQFEVDVQKNGQRHVVYALFIKECNGSDFLKGFKNQEERAAYAARREKNGLVNGEDYYKKEGEYPVDFLAAKFGNESFGSHVANVCKDLINGFFRTHELDIPGTNEKVTLLAANDNGELHLHYCKTESVERCKNIYTSSSLKNIELEGKKFQELLDQEFSEQKITLKNNEFFVFEFEYEGQKQFAVAYKYPSRDMHNVCSFPNAQQRQQFIIEFSKEKKWIDINGAFAKTLVYDAEYAKKQITEDTSLFDPQKLFKTINFKQLFLCDFPTTKQGAAIYALAYRATKDEVLFFKSSEARTYYINQNLSGSIDCSAINTKANEVLNSIDDTEKYRFFEMAFDEAQKTDGTSQKTTIYCMCTKKENERITNWWLSEDERKKNFDICFPNAQLVTTLKLTDTIDAANVRKQVSETEYQNVTDALEYYKEQYWTADLKTNDDNTIYALAIGQSVTPLFFSSKKARREAIKQTSCYSFRLLDEQIRKTMTEQEVYNFPGDKIYIEATYNINGRNVYAVIYHITKNNITEITDFSRLSKKEKDEFLASQEGLSLIRYEDLYKNEQDAQKQYKDEYIAKVVSPEHLNQMTAEGSELAKTNNKQFIFFDIPTTNRYVVHSLIYNDVGTFFNTPRILHFASAEARDSYISSKLPTYACKYPSQVSSLLNLFDTRVAYAIAIDPKKQRAKLEELLKEKLIDKILYQSNQYWLEEQVDIDGKQLNILFYRYNNKLYISIHYAKEKITEIIKQKKLIDAKTPFTQSHEYPAALGQYLNDSLTQPNNLDLLDKNLYNKEFATLIITKTTNSNYQELSILMFKQNDTKERHFFKTTKEMEDYKSSLVGFIDGYSRSRQDEFFMQIVGKAFNEEKAEKDKKNLFYVIEDTAKKMGHLVVCSSSGEILISRNSSLALLNQDVQVYLKTEGWEKFNMDEWKKIPLAASEKRDLSKQLFNGVILAYYEQKKLGEGKYVYRESANYACIIKHTKGKQEIEAPQFFKIGQPELKQELDSLVGYEELK